MLARLAVLLALAPAAGCFSPSYPSGVRCGPGGECPPGQVCGAGGVCGATGGADAGPPGDDAGEVGADAAPADAESAPDACVPGPELCNGVDDDCDVMVDEGFQVGEPCEGPDGDVCVDDVWICDPGGASTSCASTDEDVELCNALDDDCDGSTDEGFEVGVACDGDDGDLCAEGAWMCDPPSGGRACSDLSPTNAEQCNGFDDDCDGNVDEDTTFLTDPANCGSCGNACTNGFGSTSCAAGACAPVCSAGAQDCDGDPDNGCEARGSGTACSGATVLGSVAGDTASPDLVATGFSETWYRVTVREDVAGTTSGINARFSLASPPGVDFDLTVVCLSCGVGDDYSSTGPGTNIVEVGRTDAIGLQPYDVLVNIHFVSASACGNWTLTVTGNIPAPPSTC